ncbi:hypothetical protein, partial [Nocardioides sp. YIM 152588]|uniref:hypothetical protein n=1 Tax=Nocardioides sp. YIM 152588 TaxID=3158259 RepID=UPI0032E45E65
MSDGTAAPAWVADSSIGWRILLSGDLPAGASGLDVAEVRRRLGALAAREGWGTPPAPLVAADPAAVRASLALPLAEPVAVGIAGSTLTVSAHHSRVDGLGLLETMGELLARPLVSAARGVGDRPRGGARPRSSRGRAGPSARRPRTRARRGGSRAASHAS